MKFIERPNLIFLIAAISLIISSFFASSTIDIHIHDTYFVIARTHIYMGVGVLFLLFWALYQIISRSLYSLYLSWLHVALTVLGTFVFLLTPLWFTTNVRNYIEFNKLNKLLTAAAFIVIYGQGLFFANLILGIIKGKRNGG